MPKTYRVRSSKHMGGYEEVGDFRATASHIAQAIRDAAHGGNPELPTLAVKTGDERTAIVHTNAAGQYVVESGANGRLPTAEAEYIISKAREAIALMPEIWSDRRFPWWTTWFLGTTMIEAMADHIRDDIMDCLGGIGVESLEFIPSTVPADDHGFGRWARITHKDPTDYTMGETLEDSFNLVTVKDHDGSLLCRSEDLLDAFYDRIV